MLALFMSHQIAFLHTAKVHVETFGNLVKELEPTLSALHVVDESLLEDARKHGFTPELEKRIHQAMQDATSTGARVVVCTCSTIGGIAESSGETSGQGFISMRIDRAMADEAVNTGKHILVVAALESTLASTRELLEDSARKLDKTPDIKMLYINEAWKHFEAGDTNAYLKTIAQSLKAYWKNHDVIVLAQASMAKAAEFCDGVGVPILSSPRLGVKAILATKI